MGQFWRVRGFEGGVGLPALGYRRDHHSPWAIFNSQLMAAAALGGGETVQVFNIYSPPITVRTGASS